MSKVKRCDICREVFDYGFLIDVKIQGGMSFTNIAEDRFEIGEKDICKACYYKLKKMLPCCCVSETEVQNANP